jgi:hypothetical protein
MAQPGDFTTIQYGGMLEDAYKAVSIAEAWEWLKRPDVPGNGGFMFSSSPEMENINRNIKYIGHSSASFAITMRSMEFIAKHGWEKFVEKQK